MSRVTGRLRDAYEAQAHEKASRTAQVGMYKWPWLLRLSSCSHAFVFEVYVMISSVSLHIAPAARLELHVHGSKSAGVGGWVAVVELHTKRLWIMSRSLAGRSTMAYFSVSICTCCDNVACTCACWSPLQLL